MLTRENFETRRSHLANLSTARHALLVEGVVRWARPRTVLEIGAYAGYMSVTIARALQEVYPDDPTRLVILDNWHDYRTSEKALRANLTHCDCQAEIVTGTSRGEFTAAAIGSVRGWPVDMAVIDGNHTAEWVESDINLALAVGAYILMLHDSESCEGVRQALDRLRESGRWNAVELPFDAGYALCIERFHKEPAEIPADRTSL